MTAEAAFTRTWRVGKYRATLSCPRPKPGQILSAFCEWEPHTPQRLSAREIEEYRAGRDAALRDLADELGVSVGVLDL